MGNSKQLHPSVQKFKTFVKKHPKIIHDVKNGSHTLQELYEEWYILGEDDPYWKSFGIEGGEDKNSDDDTSNTSDNDEKYRKWMNQIGNVMQKVDANQMQHHLNNLSKVIASLQGVLSQFQGQQQNVPATKNEPVHPFSFRKD
ncbi:YlbD family protein [Heyndrickxia sp. NPDC080065]|uniref:YlbD family protein n=1 Tax=Heyndrickxia sp. NPDC080065 TaxID=3390568 RepID=UPI003CFED25C